MFHLAVEFRKDIKRFLEFHPQRAVVENGVRANAGDEKGFRELCAWLKANKIEPRAALALLQDVRKLSS